MALEGDEVGLENLFVDTSDTTVTFPNCPDVATEFFKPRRTSTRKTESIDEKIQAHIDRYDEYMQRTQRGVTIYGREKEERSCASSTSAPRKPPDKGINDKIQYHIDRYEEYMRKVEQGVTLFGQKEEKEDGKGTGRKRPAEKEASGVPAAKTATIEGQSMHAHDHQESVAIECYVCSVITESPVVFMPCEHKITCTDCAPRVKKCLQCRKDVKEKIWTILVNINSEGSGPEIGGRRSDNLRDDIEAEGLPNHQDPQTWDTWDHMIERERRDRIHEEPQGDSSNEQPAAVQGVEQGNRESPRQRQLLAHCSDREAPTGECCISFSRYPHEYSYGEVQDIV